MTVEAPPRLSDEVDLALARQPEMMQVFIDLFGPYPFAGYTVVVSRRVRTPGSGVSGDRRTVTYPPVDSVTC